MTSGYRGAAPSGAHSTWNRLLVVVAWGAIAFGVVLRVFHWDTFLYDMWGDRDLARSAFLGQEFQFNGPELGGTPGARTPGGFYHYLLYVLLQISGDPRFFHALLVVFDGVILAIIFSIARRALSTPFALLAAAFYATSPVALDHALYLYNPSFSLIFVAVALWLLVRLIVDRRSAVLPWLVLVVALAMQIHLSQALLLPIIVIAVIVFRVPCEPRDVGLAGFAFILAFAPFLIDQAGQGWPIVDVMFANRQSSRIEPLPMLRASLAVELLQLLAHYDHWPFVRFVQNGFGWSEYIGANLLTNTPVVIWVIGVVTHLVLVARNAMDADRLRVLGLMYIIVGVTLGILVASNTDIYSRRVLMLLIPGAVILAAASEDLRAIFWRRGATVVAWTMLALLGINLAFTATAWFGRNKIVYPSYADRIALLDGLRQAFAISDQRLITGVAEIRRDEKTGAWRLSPATELQAFDYLVWWRHREKSQPDGWNGCAVAIDLTHGEAVTAQQLPALTQIVRDLMPLPLDVEKVSIGDWPFVFVAYHPVNGNCVRTFSNRWLLTANEVRALAATRNLPIDATVTLAAEPSWTQVAARLGRGFGFLHADFRYAGGQLTVTIEGPSLRGHGGLKDEWLMNPRLEFTSPAHHSTIVVTFGTTYLGRGGTLSPWIVATRIPPGTYRVSLVADSYLDNRADERPIRLVLTDGLILK